ncbi:MAG: DNA polymerase III subunit delta' [Campylobacteraceae bacterium]|nr:DNA polymerase III subunit delta' [Campylobacteraceae bacterium]
MKQNKKELQSYILICKNLQKAYKHLEINFCGKNCKLFLKDDFLLEDAKNVVKEAYIAESNQKILVLGAKNYNIYAQNSLLKILEEPPKNIVFILVCETKNVFLPTIRSRMLSKNLDFEEDKIELDLDIKNLELNTIYDFIQKNLRIGKNELKALLQTIVTKSIVEAHIFFTAKEMKYFEILLQLSELNARPNNILISLLLTIYLKKR